MSTKQKISDAGKALESVIEEAFKQYTHEVSRPCKHLFYGSIKAGLVIDSVQRIGGKPLQSILNFSGPYSISACEVLLSYLNSLHSIVVSYKTYDAFKNHYTSNLDFSNTHNPTPPPTSHATEPLPSSPFVNSPTEAKPRRIPGLIDRAFLEREAARNFQPIDFYSSTDSAQWSGIANGLYVKPQEYDLILGSIRRRLQKSIAVVALLSGTGGMGKTSMARQIANDLVSCSSSLDCSVFWFSYDNTELEQVTALKKAVAASSGQIAIVFVDDWNRHEEEVQIELNKWIKNKNETSAVKFILTNRVKKVSEADCNLNKLDPQLIHYIHDLDVKTNPLDRKALVEHIVKSATDSPEQKLPESLIRKLAEAKPILLAFVAIRLKEQYSRHKLDYSEAETLGGLLRTIIRGDLEQIPPNLAKSLQLYAGWYYRYIDNLANGRARNLITHAAFLEIAREFGTDKQSDMTDYEDKDLFLSQNSRLRYYVCLQESGAPFSLYGKEKVYDPQGRKDSPLVLFNHDDLASALICAEDYEPLEKRLHQLSLSSSSISTASTTLYNAVVIEETNSKFRLSEEEAWPHIKRLLGQKNSHHAWAGLLTATKPRVLFDDQLRREDKTRWHYINLCKKVVGHNYWFDRNLIRFVESQHKNDLSKQIAHLRPIIQSNRETATSTLLVSYRRWLGSAGRHDATLANEWKKENKAQLESDDPIVLCRLLNDATNWGLVINRSLSIIQAITPQTANNTTEYHQLYKAALTNVARHNKPEALKFVNAVIDGQLPGFLRPICLGALKDLPDARETVKALARNLLDNSTVREQTLVISCLRVLRRESDCLDIARKVTKRLPYTPKFAQTLTECMDMLRFEDDGPKLAATILGMMPVDGSIPKCLDCLILHVGFQSEELAHYKARLNEHPPESLTAKTLEFMIANGWFTHTPPWETIYTLAREEKYSSLQIAYLRQLTDVQVRNSIIDQFITETRPEQLPISLVPLFAYCLQELALKQAEVILKQVLTIHNPTRENRFLQYRLYQTPLKGSTLWENECQTLLSNYKAPARNVPRDLIASCLINRRDQNAEVEHIRRHYLTNWREEYKLEFNRNGSKRQNPTITKHIQAALWGCTDPDLVLNTAKAIFNDDGVWARYPQLYRAAEDVVLSDRKNSFNIGTYLAEEGVSS